MIGCANVNGVSRLIRPDLSSSTFAPWNCSSSRPASSAVMLEGAWSPRTAVARASWAAPGDSLARLTETSLVTPSAASSRSRGASAVAGRIARSAAASRSAWTNSGLPPVSSPTTAQKPSSGSGIASVAASDAIAPAPRGRGRSMTATGSASNSATSTGCVASWAGRLATTAVTATPSIRRARKASQRNEGASHQWRSSTTSSVARPDARLAVNQYRPWRTANDGSPRLSDHSSSRAAVNSDSAGAAAPVKSSARASGDAAITTESKS